jgi:hypothetical protein
MERRQAGKVERELERKTVDVCMRLGTSVWSLRNEDARLPARDCALGLVGCQRDIIGAP